MKFLFILVSLNAFAFTPPTDKTSLLPQNNVVEVTKKQSVVANVDQYSVCGTINTLDKFGNCTVNISNPPVITCCTFSVTAGTPLATVQRSASANEAWAKLRVESLTPAEQNQVRPNQQALMWFMSNIYFPYYMK